MIRVAVITVSDSAHAGVRDDVSGPAVKHRLEELGWEVVLQEAVPDEAGLIAARLASVADSGTVSVIFTTGGTGISARDVTPEATRSVVEKEIPGLGELMRAQGRQFTPRAVLSRGVAGTRGRVLIVNLPGSPGGAVQSLNVIVELTPHIVQLLRGETEHAVPAGNQNPVPNVS